MTSTVRPADALEDYHRLDDRAHAFDELLADDGSVRPGWRRLSDGLGELAVGGLRSVVADVARLLEDDGVTYTPHPGADRSLAEPGAGPAPSPDQALATPRPWRLDAVPMVLGADEWLPLERGLVQRAELLDALLTDLYGEQRLLATGAIPPAAVFGHAEFLRPVIDTPLASRRLFTLAVDVGRDADGRWRVTSDRSQAPSGAGYAMQNRRIVSRALPELYRESRLQRLTPFFHAMRVALTDAAPSRSEDPRVVVLSPGSRSETAFDQAFLASLLGFPLLEGSDLTVRDGCVYTRVLGKLEQVDVILRRLDSVWADPLELRSGSRLGVSGLLECVRRGTVSVVNPLGSGVLENPALMPYLPRLCRQLLGEDLRLESVRTHWCGDPDGLAYVLAHLDEQVIRTINRGQGRSVVGSALTADQRRDVVAAVRARPHRFVGQELLSLSSTPTAVRTEAGGHRLAPRPVVLRTFAVRRGAGYTTMLGGLARVADTPAQLRGALVGTDGGGLSKDVWVTGGGEDRPTEPAGWLRGTTTLRADGGEAVRLGTAGGAPFAMVPRVLDDLYWFGRYAERAEDLLRLVLAARSVAVETDSDLMPGHALPALLTAITEVSATYPGFTAPGVHDDVDRGIAELRRVLLDRTLSGTVAQSLSALQAAAVGVRDQLSNDVWMVLAGVDRALTTLAREPRDRGNQLIDTSEQVLSGLLALAGITSENMVRDPGWYLMDVGRGLERALQLTALLRHTVCAPHPDDSADDLVVEAVLIASESIVTYRRRYRGYAPAEALLQLLVLDRANPRSVRYQLDRISADLSAVPTDSDSPRPLRLVEALSARLDQVEPVGLVAAADGSRPELAAFLDDVRGTLRELSRALGEHYLKPAPVPQPLAVQIQRQARSRIRRVP